MDASQVPVQASDKPQHRGSRHLRVGLALEAKEVHVASIWLVAQPALQPATLVGPIFVRVDLAGRPALLLGFDDPRISRGAYQPKQLGHSYASLYSGQIQVAVPFDAIADLSELRIRVLDTTRLTGLPTGPDALAGLFDAPAATAVEMADLGLDAMRRHRDFIGVAGQIGWVLDPGRFEIAGEAACGFRWRLRRADGQVVAESAKAHASRADCEDEIRWVRRYAPLASIGSLDLPGSTCRAER